MGRPRSVSSSPRPHLHHHKFARPSTNSASVTLAITFVITLALLLSYLLMASTDSNSSRPQASHTLQPQQQQQQQPQHSQQPLTHHTMSNTDSKPPPDEQFVGDTGLFDKTKYQYLVGKRLIDTSKGESLPVNRAGEGTEWIDVQKFVTEERGRSAGSTRVLGPGEMMTMDLQPSRLNIIYDEQKRVADVHYG